MLAFRLLERAMKGAEADSLGFWDMDMTGSFGLETILIVVVAGAANVLNDDLLSFRCSLSLAKGRVSRSTTAEELSSLWGLWLFFEVTPFSLDNSTESVSGTVFSLTLSEVLVVNIEEDPKDTVTILPAAAALFKDSLAGSLLVMIAGVIVFEWELTFEWEMDLDCKLALDCVVAFPEIVGSILVRGREPCSRFLRIFACVTD